MIVEPVMMNIGVVPPPPGYLASLADLLHAHGALLTFDEVKTGLTIAPGGATERFGVVPDIVCLAKALGGGVPCGAIGGTDRGDGTSSPTAPTSRSARSTATRSRWPRPRRCCSRCSPRPPTRHLDDLRDDLTERVHHVLGRHRIPGYVSAYGAKGAVVFSPVRIRDYRDFCRYDARYGHAHWLYQHNGGVFLPPWGKAEQWTLSVQHTADDIDLVVANLERFARDLPRMTTCPAVDPRPPRAGRPAGTARRADRTRSGTSSSSAAGTTGSPARPISPRPAARCSCSSAGSGSAARARSSSRSPTPGTW